MNIIKKIINWVLIKLRIKKPNIEAMRTYQRFSLGYLLNLHAHISTMHVKFKDADKIDQMDRETLPPRFR